jgi:hypothetical protein
LGPIRAFGVLWASGIVLIPQRVAPKVPDRLINALSQTGTPSAVIAA